MKFNKGFVADYEDKQQEKQRQNDLRKKHKIEDPNKVVVEKPSLTKFLIQTLGMIIRILATICLVLLAAVGVLALIYPEPRDAIWQVLSDIYAQITGFIGIAQ